jgi:hypothetical protein
LYYLARDNNNNDNDNGSYRSANSAKSGISSNNQKPNPLLNGAYDEAEAHASFQQALMEWRTGGAAKTHQTHLNSSKNQHAVSMLENIKPTQDSNVSTDTSDLGSKKNNQNKTLQELEKAIHSNHSLSYAERMLLHKFRRNDMDMSINTADKFFKSKISFVLFASDNLVTLYQKLNIDQFNNSQIVVEVIFKIYTNKYSFLSIYILFLGS